MSADPQINKLGNKFANEMNQSKKPDPNNFIPNSPDPILDAVLRTMSPLLADAHQRNELSTNYPGVPGINFYFNRVKSPTGTFEWRFKEYVIYP